MNKLLAVYLPIRKNRFLSFFIIWMRYLIGFAFVPSGLTKLLGERFTALPTSHPVGYFFESMYQTGLYWKFLGLMQMVSALLLMTQRFATLGNLLFLSIIANVFLITYAVGFDGTVYITFLLLFASVGMLLWDFPKWVSVFTKDNFKLNLDISNLPTYQPLHVVAGVIFYLESLLFGLLPKFIEIKSPNTMGIVLALIVLTAIIVFALSLRKKKV